MLERGYLTVGDTLFEAQFDPDRWRERIRGLLAVPGVSFVPGGSPGGMGEYFAFPFSARPEEYVGRIVERAAGLVGLCRREYDCYDLACHIGDIEDVATSMGAMVRFVVAFRPAHIHRPVSRPLPCSITSAAATAAS